MSKCAMRSAQFKTVVEKNPTNELFRFSLAQALLAEGRSSDAIPPLRFCAEAKSDWMMPRILLGKALIASGQKEEARPWLEQALAIAIDQDHEDPERELRALLADF